LYDPPANWPISDVVVDTVATLPLGVAAETPHRTVPLAQRGGAVPRLPISLAACAVGEALVSQISRKYGAPFESLPTACHCITLPELIGVAVAEAVNSYAFTIN